MRLALIDDSGNIFYVTGRITDYTAAGLHQPGTIEAKMLPRERYTTILSAIGLMQAVSEELHRIWRPARRAA